VPVYAAAVPALPAAPAGIDAPEVLADRIQILLVQLALAQPLDSGPVGVELLWNMPLIVAPAVPAAHANNVAEMMRYEEMHGCAKTIAARLEVHQSQQQQGTPLKGATCQIVSLLLTALGFMNQDIMLLQRTETCLLEMNVRGKRTENATGTSTVATPDFVIRRRNLRTVGVVARVLEKARGQRKLQDVVPQAFAQALAAAQLNMRVSVAHASFVVAQTFQLSDCSF
jgi:hypothetical protein